MPSGSGRTGCSPRSILPGCGRSGTDWNRTFRAARNHLAEDDRPEKVRASFGENYGRLRELKTVYDPMNLFHINANIAPV